MNAWTRLRAWVFASRLERDLADEMDAHRQMLEAQFRRDGLSAAEARLAASRRFGNRSAPLERSREQWRMLWLDALARDVRFALRLIRKQPMLTSAAILTIALGIGANTAVTSILETALLNPLGMRDAGHVVVVSERIDRLQMRNVETSAVELREIGGMRDTFSAVAGIEGRWWTADQGGEPVRLLGSAVTPEFFNVFNERPRIGRFFTSEDRQSVVLSYRFWHARFGDDPDVVGRTLMLDGQPHRIVGVAPEHFCLPATADAWTPLVLTPNRFRRGWAM